MHVVHPGTVPGSWTSLLKTFLAIMSKPCGFVVNQLGEMCHLFHTPATLAYGLHSSAPPGPVCQWRTTSQTWVDVKNEIEKETKKGPEAHITSFQMAMHISDIFLSSFHQAKDSHLSNIWPEMILNRQAQMV